MSNDGKFKSGNSVASKYRTEFSDMMLEYFNRCGEDYPTFELFAESIGVTNDTLLNWREKYSRFRNAYARCKNIQKGKTISGAMVGKYNPQFAKFMAVNNFGMVEKSESDSSVKFEISFPEEMAGEFE